MEWHIITGEYPPQHGGVGDYTYELALELSRAGERVHVWTPEPDSGLPAPDRDIDVHLLPRNFGWRWLAALDRGLAKSRDPERSVIVQYVPHMYGWKSMNFALCFWMMLRRKLNFSVMFHEVAFPFRKGQPLKHHVLAVVHRLMARSIARSADRVFTSTDHYRTLLTRLAPAATVRFLRIFSNVPFSSTRDVHDRVRPAWAGTRPIVGVFSSFGNEICQQLDRALPALLADSTIKFLLIGPGEDYMADFCRRFPALRNQINTSGRVNALQAGPYLQSCDVLLQLYPDGACTARGTLLAALASGTPVVTTAGRLTGAVLKCNGALAFADDDPGSIAQTVHQLLADKAAARAVGAAGRRLYESEFDVSVTLDILSEGRLSACRLARSA